MSEYGELRVTHTARGIAKYEIEVTHKQLYKHQVIKGDDRQIVVRKASMKAAQWDEMERKGVKGEKGGEKGSGLELQGHRNRRFQQQ